MSEQTGTTQLDTLVLRTNKQAMDYLQTDNFPAALGLLRQAIGLITDPHNTQLGLMAITCNNIGCYYKRLGRPKTALKYYREALKQEARTQADTTNIAGTHLNICAVWSKLTQHSKAYGHANAALSLLNCVEPSPAIAHTLVIAYHSAGTELEFLLEFREAMQTYHTGWQVAEQYLGVSHSLTEVLRNSFHLVKQRLTDKADRPRSQMKWGVQLKMGLSALVNKTLPRLQNFSNRSFDRPSTDSSNLRAIMMKPTSLTGDKASVASNLSASTSTRTGGKGKYYSRQALQVKSSEKRAKDLRVSAAVMIQRWWRARRRRRPVNYAGRKHRHKSLSLPGKLPASPNHSKAAVKLSPLTKPARHQKPRQVQQKASDVGPTPKAKKRGVISTLEAKSSTPSKPPRVQGLTSNRTVEQQRAATTIQKTFRMWRVRRLYLGIREAVVFIQRAYRNRCTRDDLLGPARRGCIAKPYSRHRGGK
jgi:hypothetical protein